MKLDRPLQYPDNRGFKNSNIVRGDDAVLKARTIGVGASTATYKFGIRQQGDPANTVLIEKTSATSSEVLVAEPIAGSDELADLTIFLQSGETSGLTVGATYLYDLEASGTTEYSAGTDITVTQSFVETLEQGSFGLTEQTIL